MERKAYAKINLTLEVLARRDDGFHEIATVLQTVELADSLVIEPSPGLSAECDNRAIPQEDNLAWRAARRLRRTMEVEAGARILVRKRIPVAAGLGGGSSDAAAALRGLNELWDLGLDLGRLAEIGAGLGSDVPFFIFGGTALAEGRGERITPLPPPPDTWLVLATPPIDVPHKTMTLYRALAPSMFTDGTATRLLMQALQDREPITSRRLTNVFEQVAPKVFPGLDDHWARMREAGASHVHLSGSGPSLFAMVGGPEAGAQIAKRCNALGLPALVVKTVASPV